MKTVLVALNATYSHTALGVRCVHSYAKKQGVENIQIWERTTGHHRRQLITELWQQKADVVVFSCYIWNISQVCSLAADLRQLCPKAVFVAAGPEVSYRVDDFLAENPAFDLALPGEGEVSTTALIKKLEKVEPHCRRDVAKGMRGSCEILPVLLDMDELPFPYEDIPSLGSRMFYYESMRGCPLKCSYCLSAAEHQDLAGSSHIVRFRSLDKVYEELDQFIAAKVKLVKFVDRTFNVKKSHAMAIWQYVIEHDNGHTGFHFELAGDLMDEDMFSLLKTARAGLIQFEIGVQSCNDHTLAAIRRRTDLDRLFSNVEKLQRPRNIHLHLDLIAGLPCEDMASFITSFNRVYSAHPHQFQLGFLKVLHGAPIQQESQEHGITHQQSAPYEVLSTRWLPYEDITVLHGVDDMVDSYYNSGRYSHIIAAIEKMFPDPFTMYRRLFQCYEESGWLQKGPGKIDCYNVLGKLIASVTEITEELQWLCKYDLALHEPPYSMPSWVSVDSTAEYRRRILDTLEDDDLRKRLIPEYAGMYPKQILRSLHAEVFPFNPITGEQEAVAIIFNYKRRDILGHATPGILFRL